MICARTSCPKRKGAPHRNRRVQLDSILNDFSGWSISRSDDRCHFFDIGQRRLISHKLFRTIIYDSKRYPVRLLKWGSADFSLFVREPSDTSAWGGRKFRNDRVRSAYTCASCECLFKWMDFHTLRSSVRKLRRTTHASRHLLPSVLYIYHHHVR